MLNRLILIGLVLGLSVGLGASMTDSRVLVLIADLSAPFGTVFINAVKMVVIPLVVAIIFTSIAQFGDPRRVGALGASAMGFYLATLFSAVMIGMGVMHIGLGLAPEITAPPFEPTDVPPLRGVVEFLTGLVPPNPFAAAAQGTLLPLIVFTALFAAAAGTLPDARRQRMVDGAQDITDALIKLVWWILWLAPIGVFGLIAPATARLGWGLVQSLGLFIACVAIGLILFTLLVYMPLLWVLGGMGPGRFFQGTVGAVTVAFSTTSTATAIPVSREEAMDNLGVSERVADLLIPLGASIYRPGSALFQGAAIIFLAHIFDVPVGAGDALGVLLATLLVSLTVAPVPSSGVVTMAPALATVGVPTAGLGLLLGIDRIPDMMRSAVNVIGQLVTAVVADRKPTVETSLQDGGGPADD